MTERRKYELTLQLESPFMFESVVNNRVGVDCAYMRGENDEPIIPAAQIKGVLRDALEHLAHATSLITDKEIKQLFGRASQAGQQDRPERGLAYFGDLAAPKANEGLHTTRIEIEDEPGIVKRGSLQVIELAAPFGDEVLFKGPLVIHYSDGLDISKAEKAIDAALRLIPAIGAYKSAGFGQVIPDGCKVSMVSNTPLSLNPSTMPNRVILDVTFDRPLLVDTTRAADNVFQSAYIVPGSVFKGAIAERLARSGMDPENEKSALGKALAALHISHAFPVDERNGKKQIRGLPIPASILHIERDKTHLFADAIDAPGIYAGVLFKGEKTVPSFVNGGKDAVAERFARHFICQNMGVDI